MTKGTSVVQQDFLVCTRPAHPYTHHGRRSCCKESEVLPIEEEGGEEVSLQRGK